MIKFRLGKGWKEFLRFLEPKRARRELGKNSRRTMLRELQLLRRDVIGYIDGEKHGVPNSPLTVLIKGSSRPLVDRGDLRQGIRTSISAKGTNAFAVRLRGAVGVLRTARRGDGKSLTDVAVALHEGFVIRVTEKVRRAVFAELRKRRKGNVRWKGGAGSPSTTWRVKGRPFVREPFEAAVPRIKLALGDSVKVTLGRL